MKKRPIVYALGLIVVGGLLGLGASGMTASMVEHTGTNEFCTGCHEMTWPAKANEEQPHFMTRSGVRPGCADCHIPHHPWYKTLMVKAESGSRDIYLHFMGKIDTIEKYQEARPELAERVWERMKKNDSETCRSCHKTEAMDPELQGPAARIMHARAQENNLTCIECHKGIGHGRH